MDHETESKMRGRTKLGTLVLILVGVGVLLGLLGGLYELSSSPVLCNTCHIMKAYVQAWKTSKHNNVPCVDCHYPPELRGTLWVKYQALAQVAKWATQTYSSKPFAEVEDASCLRSGCHSTRLIQGKGVFKRGIIFDHTPHLGEVRRGRQLRCTSCHSQIVVGTHIEVTESTCFLCHFKGMKTARELKPLGGCPGCHMPPKGEIHVGSITFSHDSLVKRGVACEKCHLNVVEGDGEAPRERCFTCHNQPEKLEKYGDTPFIHDFHVAGHNIECARCHSEIKHRLPPPIGLPVSRLLRWIFEPTRAEAADETAQGRKAAPPFQHQRSRELQCSSCHAATHRGVLEMYIGMGGRGAPIIPSHMFQVRVECVACHVAPEWEQHRAAIVGQTFRPSESACLGCHGARYKGMLEGWAKTMDTMTAVVKSKLVSAQALLASTPMGHPKYTEARNLIRDAEHNVDFVIFGKGVHNVFYAADLLQVSNGYLDRAVRALGKPPTALPEETLIRGGYCAVLCHNRAGVKLPERVRFGNQRVPHGRHVTEFGATCTACHSSERHKAVTATTGTCQGCHHSPDNTRCTACHRLQRALYAGEVKVPGIEKPEPNVMINAVADCTGCHDWSQKHSRQAVAKKCVGCHDPQYEAFIKGWEDETRQETTKAADALKRASAALAVAKRKGRETAKAELLLREGQGYLDLVRKARGVHNLPLALAILDRAGQNAREVLSAFPSR